MKVHANAALGPAGRLALVEAIESGMTPATAHCWWHRWKAAGEEARRLGLWLEDRSSRPHRQLVCPERLGLAGQEGSASKRHESAIRPTCVSGEPGTLAH
jgi:hypothetical protein